MKGSRRGRACGVVGEGEQNIARRCQNSHDGYLPLRIETQNALYGDLVNLQIVILVYVLPSSRQKSLL